ncbi:MAG: hypothetical protein EA397_17375 [Deltaproteobacteria bacterium]|nr:MAG: hypothetical protein EA397_17375 [Deltaproteobacteria bacterium]
MADRELSKGEVRALLRRLRDACRSPSGVSFSAAAVFDRDDEIGISEDRAIREVLMELEVDDYVKTMDAEKPPAGDQHVFFGLHPDEESDIYIKFAERQGFKILSFKEHRE